MKSKLNSKRDWNNYKETSTAHFSQTIGEFKGHLDFPTDFPCYVVSYKETDQDLSFHVRHVFVARQDFYPPKEKNYGLIVFLKMIPLGVVLLVLAMCFAMWVEYNPPPPNIEEQELAKKLDNISSLSNQVNEIKQVYSDNCSYLTFSEEISLIHQTYEEKCSLRISSVQDKCLAFSEEGLDKACSDRTKQRKLDIIQQVLSPDSIPVSPHGPHGGQ